MRLHPLTSVVLAAALAATSACSSGDTDPTSAAPESASSISDSVETSASAETPTPEQDAAADALIEFNVDITDHDLDPDDFAKPSIDRAVKDSTTTAAQKQLVAVAKDWFTNIALHPNDILATEVDDSMYADAKRLMTPDGYQYVLDLLPEVRLEVDHKGPKGEGNEPGYDAFNSLQALTGFHLGNEAVLGDADTVRIDPKITKFSFSKLPYARAVSADATYVVHAYLNRAARKMTKKATGKDATAERLTATSSIFLINTLGTDEWKVYGWRTSIKSTGFELPGNPELL